MPPTLMDIHHTHGGASAPPAANLSDDFAETYSSAADCRQFSNDLLTMIRAVETCPHSMRTPLAEVSSVTSSRMSFALCIVLNKPAETMNRLSEEVKPLMGGWMIEDAEFLRPQGPLGKLFLAQMARSATAAQLVALEQWGFTPALVMDDYDFIYDLVRANNVALLRELERPPWSLTTEKLLGAVRLACPNLEDMEPHARTFYWGLLGGDPGA